MASKKSKKKPNSNSNPNKSKKAKQAKKSNQAKKGSGQNKKNASGRARSGGPAKRDAKLAPASASKSTVSKSAQRRPRVKQRAGGIQPSDVPREIAVFDPDGVEAVFDVLPSDDALAEAADRLSGLGHPSRLKAVIALSVAELCVGDLAAIVGLSLSATSTMLKQLRALGFLGTRSAGKQTYYRLVSGLPGGLMEVAFAEEPTAS